MHVGELGHGIGRGLGYHGVYEGAAKGDAERYTPIRSGISPRLGLCIGSWFGMG